MNNINRSETADTPSVFFDEQTKTLSIIGNSYPENCSNIYEPIIEFVSNYNVSDFQKLKLHFYYNLINSTSVVYVSKLVLKVSDLKKKGLEVNVKWSYDRFDEELLDLGEKFSSISELEFEYEPIVDENDVN